MIKRTFAFPWMNTVRGLCLLCLLAGCSTVPATMPAATTPTESVPATAAPTAAAPTLQPSATPTPTRIPSPTPNPLPVIHSPLKDVPIDQLSGIISNPYDPPRPGMDDGHHGVDFGFYRYNGKVGMQGWPVLSALSGTVAGVLLDRPPYGNTIIIETPLSGFSGSWQAALNLPAPLDQVIPSESLTCPDASGITYREDGSRSLYILYAHLDTPPLRAIGDTVESGEEIGAAGTTGYSVNVHLHFEVRVGPSGAQFPSMGHYETGTTEEERANYCTWRISGIFQLVDPMDILLSEG
ncbi:MAG: M23 family metallopeptidase [Chloroflexi bacterium]|nr:M23 family metallopeptidase [Chloroflexota bacterium]